jgi:hypothetical protein
MRDQAAVPIATGVRTPELSLRVDPFSGPVTGPGPLPADQGSMPTEDRFRLHQQPAAVMLLASQGRQRLSLLALVWARDWLAPR